MYVILVILLIYASLGVINNQTLPPPCDSQIYCYGPLLHTVQTSGVFPTSSRFLIMKMIHEETVILQNFYALMESTGQNPSTEQVHDFVSDNFEYVNDTEVEGWIPPDYNLNVEFLTEIGNETIKRFATDLISIWPVLGKKVRNEIMQNETYYSYIPVPNGFIGVTETNSENSYWDSYWIIKGLLISEMGDTAKGMIENYFSIIQRYGTVPRYGRIYHIRMSQPPFLPIMVYDYMQYYSDVEWLRNNIHYIDEVLTFWFNNRMKYIEIGNETYLVAYYNSECSGPRPYYYLSDLTLTEIFIDEQQRQQAYVDFKSAEESSYHTGSSRWIFDEFGGNEANISFTQTTRVVPVDLNAILCKAFSDISKLYLLLGDNLNAHYWETEAANIQRSITELLWDESDGIWHDYDMQTGTLRRYFYASNIAPLWANCFNITEGPAIGNKVLNYFNKNNISSYFGGIPVSLTYTGSGWDFPIALAPMQDFVVQGLRNSNNEEAVAAAKMFAERWIDANIIGYRNTSFMFSRYDAVNPGEYGPGNYSHVVGYGWSNAVALQFIYDYYRTP